MTSHVIAYRSLELLFGSHTFHFNCYLIILIAYLRKYAAYLGCCYLTVTSSEDANTLQADLDTLQEWERTWDMEFNPSKCQVLHITCSRQPLQSQYTLHSQFLESVDSAKYLGVNITQDLNWNHHINEITGKANRTLGFVKRNVKTKNEAVKELAYKRGWTGGRGYGDRGCGIGGRGCGIGGRGGGKRE